MIKLLSLLLILSACRTPDLQDSSMPKAEDDRLSSSLFPLRDLRPLKKLDIHAFDVTAPSATSLDDLLRMEAPKILDMVKYTGLLSVESYSIGNGGRSVYLKLKNPQDSTRWQLGFSLDCGTPDLSGMVTCSPKGPNRGLFEGLWPTDCSRGAISLRDASTKLRAVVCSDKYYSNYGVLQEHWYVWSDLFDAQDVTGGSPEP